MESKEMERKGDLYSIKFERKKFNKIEKAEQGQLEEFQRGKNEFAPYVTGDIGKLISEKDQI